MSRFQSKNYKKSKYEGVYSEELIINGKNIGIVYTKTNTNFTLDATIAAQIGLPVTNSQEQEEFLDTYSVN
jgi:hypothetical protein